MRLFRLTLAHKIFAIGILGVSGLAVLAAIAYLGLVSQTSFTDLADAAGADAASARELVGDMLQARRAEKDFQLRNDDKYATHQKEMSARAGDELAKLRRAIAPNENGLLVKLDAVIAGWKTYTVVFAELAEAKRSLGLKPDVGLEGALRNSVHAIEDKLKAVNNDRLTGDMLMLRRHEKDFMLRRDSQYVDAMKKAVDEFTAALGETGLPASDKAELSGKLAAYHRDFLSWVAGAGRVAEAQKSLSELFARIEPQIDAVIQEITDTQHRASEANIAARAGMMRNMAIALVLIMIGVGGLAFVIGRSVSRPIRHMTTAMGDLAAGNLDVSITGGARHDEIGAMAKALGVFKENATERRRLAAERKDVEARAAAERKAELNEIADRFSAAVGSVVQVVSSSASQLESAASALTETAQTTQNLSTAVAAASEEASANVHSVAAAAEEMTSSVNEIGRHVLESKTIAEKAVSQAERTDARIGQLSQAANRIGDVVKMITAIAEQTNLLALNATIEAARAGDSGRGFAVVAHEVKALATQTAKATDEIGIQINAMQSATQESVSAIKEIGATIGQISQIATAIAAAVEEQGAATQEISRNVQQAAQGTSEVAANISNVNKGAGATGSASTQVLASTRALSAEGVRLKQEVETFLLAVRAA